jgi:hypothetical protein
MLVIIAEFYERDAVSISAGDRRWLRMKKRPPTHWRIWIGNLNRKSHPLLDRNSMSLTKLRRDQIAPGSFAGYNTQTTTVCVGKHLVIYVMSSGVVKDIIRKWRLPPDIEPRLQQNWPIRRSKVAWPPPLGPALDDGDLDRLASQFMRRVHAIMQSMR